MTTQNQTNKDFADFEKEALQETSLDTFKTTLVNSFKKLHREQLEIIEEKISAIEERCYQETREGLEKHIKKQLEENFQELIKSTQIHILHLLSPLFKRAEEDLGRLGIEVAKTNALCHQIQEKYSFRWDKPFLVLITATALTGAFIGLSLVLMQTKPFAFFLMDSIAREKYGHGVKYIKGREMVEASQVEEKREEIKNKKKALK